MDQPMLELLVQTGAQRGRRWPLNTGQMTLGRSAACDIRVFDAIVSRHHCELTVEESGVHFRDLGSSNASLVNGEPCEEATLSEGDIITIGETTFIVVATNETNPYLPPDDEDPTPITLSLADSRYVADVMEAETALKTGDEFRDLFVFTRKMSQTETVPELFELFRETLDDIFQPQALWIVNFMGESPEVVVHGLAGKATRENLPLDHMRRCVNQRAGLLLPTRKSLQGSKGLETYIAAPLMVGNKAIGGVALYAAVPMAVYDERNLDYLVALCHVFAPHYRALENLAQLKRDYHRSDESIGRETGLVGSSASMEDVRQRINMAAASHLNVLLCGETGTGKELAARMLHDMSLRSEGPYVVVNCAAIPPDLFESDMFGHEKGSFTGATEKRIGRFEEAHGGTLFLDEIGELDSNAQASLLRAIETQSYYRVGGGEISVDVRVVAATNRMPISNGQRTSLRQDLYHRLAGFELLLPPLRERMEDIPELIDFFLRAMRSEGHRTPMRISDEAIDKLSNWTWPGNVRELRSCIERAAAMTPGEVIHAEHIITSSSAAATGHSVEYTALTMADAERDHIVRILAREGGNIRATARTLDISRTTLYKKMEDYGIQP